MLGAATAALGEGFPVAVTRFSAVFRGLAVVVGRTVFFGTGFAALVARATGRFAAAAFPVGFFALLGGLTGRAAAAALPVFLSVLATRLSGRLAFPAATAGFALAAAFAVGVNIAGFAGRFAAAARPDDLDALLFLETARAIEASPGEHRRLRPRSWRCLRPMTLLVGDEEEEEEE
jgi:hypothetical protein